MPDLRETPDSRRAARLMRDGAVRGAVGSFEAPLTRRAFRESLGDSTARTPAPSFTVTEESLRLSAAMTRALHASVGVSAGRRDRSARAGFAEAHPDPREPADYSLRDRAEASSDAVELEIAQDPQPAPETAPSSEAAPVPTPPLEATRPLPAVVEASVPRESHPRILRPAAPILAVPVVPRPEPLLPASPARHRLPVRHARSRRLAGFGASMAFAMAGFLVVGSAAAVTATVTPEPVAVVAEAPEVESLPVVRIELPTTPAAPSALSADVVLPDVASGASQFVVATCDQPAVTAALAAGDDAATIAAVGGASEFRAAVAGGTAPCLNLSDPARAWVVVDKTLPLVPIDHTPDALAVPAGVRMLDGGQLRQDAATAMSAMVDAARAAGAGEVAVGSAFRSYETQVSTYDGHVARRGIEGADLVSARPGHSEHQTGLAADVVPCAAECGTIDDLAATPQGAWISEHAWEYGWVVRYEDGGTEVTGYLPEPWHLRYIGVDLAREYHDGGWHTLEEFFGLPAAPHYDH